jgi:hypothetical protein
MIDSDRTTHDGADPAAPVPAGRDGAGGASAVDPERVAERVYRLLLADLRLDRARHTATPQEG